MAKTLTAAAVAKMQPGKSLREIPDGQSVGLYLLLYPTGKKVWAWRYRRPVDRRPAKLTLGTVFIDGKAEPNVAPVIGGHLTLAGARRLVAELKHDIALGRDPGASHMAVKRNVTTAETFTTAARDFIDLHAKKNTRRWAETARVLGFDQSGEIINRSLASRWRDKPLVEIDEDLIFHVIEEARNRGIPGLEKRNKGQSEARARSVHSALSVMLAWCKVKRRVKVNPIAALSSPAAPKARERVLSGQEIVKFWAACTATGSPFGSLLKLLLLLGARLNEVAGMRRSEISDDGTWTIPGTRTKNHRTHILPLAPLARDVLGEVQPIHGVDLIFTTTGKTPVSGWSKTKRRLDGVMKIPPWRLHDLRRTAATGMAEIGIPPHILEAVLNHVSGAKAGVAGVYNRSLYTSEKKAALERWAVHIAGLVAGKTANVTPLRKTKV
jgi:integrase